MKRQMKAVVGAIAIAVAFAVAWPSSAGARVNWVCDVPGEGTRCSSQQQTPRATGSRPRTRTRVKPSTESSARSAASSQADR